MPFDAFLAFTGALFCTGLAGFVFWKDPRSFVHRIFAAGMLALALRETFAGLGGQALSFADWAYWKHWELIATACLPGSWLLFSVSFARANATDFVAKWKWPAGLAFVLPLILATSFQDSFFYRIPYIEESLPKLIGLGWSGYAYYIFFLLMSVLILMHLEETLRSSTGSKRWQIKFMILGLGSFFAVQIYTISHILLFSALDRDLRVINSYALLVADILILLSLTRSHLLIKDIYLSQTFLYNSIVIIVVGVYLLTVGVLVKVVEYFGRSSILPLETFFVFLSLVGLAIILLSDQLRQKSRQFINRHFRRPRYDYGQVWTSFTQRTSSLLDLRELCGAVATMVSETFGTPDVTLWLVDGSERVSLGGSTALSYGHPSLPCAEQAAKTLIRYFQKQKRQDYITLSPSLLAELEHSFSLPWPDTEIRYAVPLIASQQLLGVMTLNDRLTREPFSEEDEELLTTIADQAAANLLNLKLSQRLVELKELEALHTLSAFFLHDLKNTSSMLSLMLQNLPKHYDNPAFREDALRVISRSVSKLNTMCSRLSLLSTKLDLHRVKTDLNELILSTLTHLHGVLKVSPVHQLRPVAPLFIDPEQIQKVLVNLLLNASEAIDEQGAIRLETDHQEDWAIITVNDTGCGMSREFLQHSLFKPFQTTKIHGSGIGLFHCKMIVEAHHGWIEVESEEGKGSTFRVFLPLTTNHSTLL